MVHKRFLGSAERRESGATCIAAKYTGRTRACLSAMGCCRAGYPSDGCIPPYGTAHHMPDAQKRRDTYTTGIPPYNPEASSSIKMHSAAPLLEFRDLQFTGQTVLIVPSDRSLSRKTGVQSNWNRRLIWGELWKSSVQQENRGRCHPGGRAHSSSS